MTPNASTPSPTPAAVDDGLTRYDICNGGVTEDFEVHEDPKGEWVKYDDAATALEAAKAEIAVWVENVTSMLADGDKDVIRAHEGGGPEDLALSLVLSVMRTRKQRDRAEAEAADLRAGLDSLIGEVFDAITVDGDPEDCMAFELVDLVNLARSLTTHSKGAEQGEGS